MRCFCYKSIFLFFLLCLEFSFLQAQELVVVSTKFDPHDLYASVHQIKDTKGHPCAMLRIAMPMIKNVSFSEEALQINYEGGVYYVYVAAKTKQITIYHPNYKPLKIRFKDFGLKVESKCVYDISLAPQDKVNQLTSDKLKEECYVTFHVRPSKSIVTINGEKIHPKRGQVSKLLPWGSYHFNVSAPDYHEFDSSFVLEKKSELKSFDIKLVPEFGWLSIDCGADSDSALVSLDGEEVGHLPVWRTEKIKSGKHQLKISKDCFKSEETQVEITDGKVTHLDVNLKRNLTRVQVIASDSVEVWVNDSLMAIGIWNGRLPQGEYKIEGRKDGFEPTMKNVSIDPSQPTLVIRLQELEKTQPKRQEITEIIEQQYGKCVIKSLADMPVKNKGDSYVLDKPLQVRSFAFMSNDESYIYRFVRLLSPSKKEYYFSVYYPYGEFDTKNPNQGLDESEVKVVDKKHKLMVLDLQKWEKGVWKIVSYEKFFPTDYLWFYDY